MCAGRFSRWGWLAEHSTPDALATLINVDVARWKELITSARITVE